MILLLDIGYKYQTAKSSQKQRCGVYVCVGCGGLYERQINNKSKAPCKTCTGRIFVTHGESKTRLYGVWTGMRKRCNAKTGKDVQNYVERGIKVCNEWESDYSAFKKFALENGYLEHLTLDRIDNNKGYDPTNCRFATMKVQSRNTRRLRSDNTTGYRGVTFKKNTNKYMAQITINSKNKSMCYQNSTDIAIIS